MKPQNQANQILWATLNVLIIVFVVLYKSYTSGTSIKPVTFVYFAAAAVFIIYGWVKYFRERK